MRKQTPRARLLVELLECRIALSTEPLRLEIIALHEFGHALGLHHNANPMSIMYDSYNAGYDISLLANDPAVIADETDLYFSLRELYSASNVASNTSPWFDALDPVPGNGVVDITWSIMPDGTKIANDVNIIHRAFDEQFGSGWPGILAGALNLWAGVSEGRISFIEWGDAGKPFNYAGPAQNDLDAGDIRIGAYYMDGPGGKLAESFFPSPIGTTTGPGDVFFDAWETWTTGDGGTGGGGGGSGGAGAPTGPGSGVGDPGSPSSPTGPAGTGGSSDGSGGSTGPSGGGAPSFDTSSADSGASSLLSAALVSEPELSPDPLTLPLPKEQTKAAPAKSSTAVTAHGRSRHQAAAKTLKLGGKAASKLSSLSAAKSLTTLPFKAL